MHFLSYMDIYYFIYYVRSEANKYDIVVRPYITEFQTKNVNANDTRLYWVDYSDGSVYPVILSIFSMYIVTCCIFPLCFFFVSDNYQW